LKQGFARHELPALGVAALLLMFFPLVGAPTGFAATLVVTGLIAARCGQWRNSAVLQPRSAASA